LLALMIAAPPLLTMIITLLGIFALSLSSPWFRDLLNAQEYVHALGRLEKGADSPEVRRQKEAIKIVLSAMYEQNNQPGSIGESILSKTWEAGEVIKAAARDYPRPSQAQVAEALPIARGLLQQDNLGKLWGSFPNTVLKVATISAALGGLIGILLSWFFRGGPLMHLFGISLQTRDGRRAGPGRCVLRALLAWGLFLLFLPFFQQQKLLETLGWSGRSWSGLQVLFLLLGIGCLIYGFFSPERGVADRIAGTHQVLH
jgi:RDD family